VTVPGPAWLGVGLLIGVAASGVLVGFPTVLQGATPDRLIGRAWTAVNAVPTIVQVLAPIVGAAILTGTGVGPLFVASGTGLVVLAAVTLHRQRALRAVPATAVAGTPTGADVSGGRE
jgi:hypothetical protein